MQPADPLELAKTVRLRDNRTKNCALLRHFF